MLRRPSCARSTDAPRDATCSALPRTLARHRLSRPGSACSSRRHAARRANAFAARRRALRHGMTIPGSRPGPSARSAVRLRRPTGTGRPRASRLHVVVRNEPDRSDGTESRSLTSPQSAAKRIPWQVGDSCLQHDALRFGLFSFSCPRLRYIRPTEAIAGSTAPRDRAHGPYNHARSAPCFMPQGLAGTRQAAGRHRTPPESANVSKLKRTAGWRRRVCPGGPAPDTPLGRRRAWGACCAARHCGPLSAAPCRSCIAQTR